ncbi:MAG TPA: hypothetical protein VMW08_01030 [Acidimicrobiales bacterium]|nr:hypothetical protein [Acidimicrobiales bacterium]
MASELTLTDILTAITNGAADENLDAVIATVKDRRQASARVTFNTLKVGDKVTISGAQKYLEGAPATVVEKKRTKVVIALDEPRGRMMAGTRLNGNPSIIVPVAA